MAAVVGVALAVLVSAAMADWNPGDAYKWVQPPDLSPAGMDVRVSQFNGIADDFLCTQTGPITDIHIWGSWLNDVLPQGETGGPNAGALSFDLAIFSDIPASQSGTGYSMPDLQNQLWGTHFDPGQYTVRPVPPEGPEGWYGPTLEPPSIYLPGNHVGIYQYNFFIDPEDAFFQQGTPEEPAVYWLGMLLPEGTPEGTEFGWKTSPVHWGDDAVVAFVLGFEDESVVFGLPLELRYPPGHPEMGQSVDMAFVITPEPATMALMGIGLAVLVARRRSRKS